LPGVVRAARVGGNTSQARVPAIRIARSGPQGSELRGAEMGNGGRVWWVGALKWARTSAARGTSDVVEAREEALKRCLSLVPLVRRPCTVAPLVPHCATVRHVSNLNYYVSATPRLSCSLHCHHLVIIRSLTFRVMQFGPIPDDRGYCSRWLLTIKSPADWLLWRLRNLYQMGGLRRVAWPYRSPDTLPSPF